jgi:KH domain
MRYNGIALKVLIPDQFTEAFAKVAANIEQSSKTVFSRPEEFKVFPGTDPHVLTISGEAGNVTDAALQVIKNCWEGDKIKFQQAIPHDAGTRLLKAVSIVRRLITQSHTARMTAGMVIGRAGGTIKHWISTSGAFIKLADLDNCPVPTERLCCISGDLASVTSALHLLIDKLSHHHAKVTALQPRTQLRLISFD